MTLSTADVAAGERLLTAAFIRLTLADVAYFTATGVAIYTLPLWVTGPIGSDKSGAGLAFGAFAVSLPLILRPVAGRLADTRGRRPLLVGGALISAVGMLGTAYADNLVLVILLRLLLGVAEAAFFVASIATLADLAPPSRMGEATSYNSLGLYLGLAFGPPLAEMLVRTAGFSAAWYGAAALSLIAAVAAAGIKNLRSGVATGGRIRLIYWKAVPPALGFFASVVAMGALFAFGALQANAVGLMPASTPLFVYGLVVVAGRLSLARFLDRLPALMLGAAALVIIAGGLMIMAFWSTPLGMALGAAVFALGVTLSTPAFFSAIFATAQPSERGAASGTASVFLDLAMGGGPMLLGLAAQAGGIPFAFGLAAAVALAGSGWILALSRHAQHAAR
jgi:predicted MFS family arabinose efflux permease